MFALVLVFKKKVLNTSKGSRSDAKTYGNIKKEEETTRKKQTLVLRFQKAFQEQGRL
jgi:hypothetical protein